MRVLIVEDEREMAEVLKVGLEEESPLVSLAFDGVIGLEVARACDFDVIVLDIMLPELDGFEVARRLRANRNRTPILMFTKLYSGCGRFLTITHRRPWGACSIPVVLFP